MLARWEEESLALTPETEQERAILAALAAAHTTDGWTPTPPPPESIRTTQPDGHPSPGATS